MSQTDLGAMAQAHDPFQVVESRQGSNALMGLIFGLSLATLFTAMGWIMADFVSPMLQFGLFFLSLGLTAVSGFLYFLNPARFLAFLLVGVVYFASEATVRSGGGGDMQSIIKGGIALMLAVLVFFTGLRYVFSSVLSAIFVGYAVFATASSAYSPNPIVGAVAGVFLLGGSIMAAKVGQGSQRDVGDYWRAVFWASVLTAILSLALWLAFPRMAIDLADASRSRLKGITGSPNALGPIVANGVILVFYMLRRSGKGWGRLFYWLMLAAFAATLVLTNSRGSIIGLCVAMMLSAVIAGRVGILGTLLIASGLSLLGAIALYPDLQYEVLSWLAQSFARTGQVAELTTFTGRQVIWAAVWSLIHKSPWIGYGMSSMTVVLPRAYADQWGNTYTTAHNCVLESLVSVGWIGTIPLMVVVVLAAWQLGRYLVSARGRTDGQAFDRDLAMCAFRVLVMMLIDGLNEKSFGGHPGSSFLALCGVVATSIFVARRQKQAEVEAVVKQGPAQGRANRPLGTASLR